MRFNHFNFLCFFHRPYSIASPHEGNTATTSTTAATTSTTAATTTTASATAAAAATATVYLACSAGYPATAASHDATSAACFIEPCADEPSLANAANISTTVPAEPD